MHFFLENKFIEDLLVKLFLKIKFYWSILAIYIYIFTHKKKLCMIWNRLHSEKLLVNFTNNYKEMASNSELNMKLYRKAEIFSCKTFSKNLLYNFINYAAFVLLKKNSLFFFLPLYAVLQKLEVVNKIKIIRVFYKKIFQFFYFKVSCAIQCVACNFLVICEISVYNIQGTNSVP